jgi:arylformamidase
VVGLVLGVAGCGMPEAPTPPREAAAPDCRGTGSTAVRDVPYRAVAGVDPDLLSLDLHLPVLPDGCGPVPLVVYVHGGGFSIGDKANQLADKVRLFTSEGWALASVNYRLSPAVRYPTHSEDVADAVAWLHAHAAEHGLDRHRTALMGHSSGAFLVALAATDGHFLADAGVDVEDVQCTVGLDTRYDVVAEIADGGPGAEAMYRNALGDSPAVWREASPVTHVNVGEHLGAFLLVTRGGADRVGATRSFATQLARARAQVTVLDASPLDHAGVNDAVGRPGETVVTPALLRFARGCLAA